MTQYQATQAVKISDQSYLPRFGVKGANAATWLQQQGIAVPAHANSWLQPDPDTLVLRLGANDFVIEETLKQHSLRFASLQQPIAAGVYKVPRHDTALALSGEGTQEVLAELCALYLRGKLLGNNALVMTQVAGISATLIRQHINGDAVIRLWCDGAYADYIKQVLAEIVGQPRKDSLSLDA